MSNTSIHLVGPRGEPIGQLGLDALTLVEEGEDMARAQNLAKKNALPKVLRDHIVLAGYEIDESALCEADEAHYAVDAYIDYGDRARRALVVSDE